MAEGQMGVGGAVEVQDVGVRELLLVAVGGAERDDHRVPGRHGGAVQVAVGSEEPPGGELERAVVAEEFLDRPGEQAGFGDGLVRVEAGAQPVQLVRVAQQGDQHGGDLVGDRLLAGDQQLEHHGGELLGAQLAGVAGGDEPAEQVHVGPGGVVGGTLVGDHVGDVALEAVQPALVRRSARVLRADRLHHLAPVAVEAHREFLGQADHGGQHPEREVGREAFDQVGAAGRGGGREFVDQGVGELLDARAQCLHPARCEGVQDELAHRRVLRRVLVQQVHLELGVLRLRHDRGELAPVLVAQ